MAAHNNSSTAAAQDGDGEAALLRSGARTAMTLIDNGTAGLYHPDVRAAAPTTKSGDGVLAWNGNGTAAYLVDSRGPRTEAQEEDLDYDMPGNVDFFELPRAPGFTAGRGEMLPYPTKTTAAAAYYDSGEALPLASEVFGGNKITSVPAVAVDKVAGAFTERLRRGLPVLGISVASLAVAGLAAGEPDPAAGFGLFLMLIVGLSAVTIGLIRA